jgi:hypothetical protein
VSRLRSGPVPRQRPRPKSFAACSGSWASSRWAGRGPDVTSRVAARQTSTPWSTPPALPSSAADSLLNFGHGSPCTILSLTGAKLGNHTGFLGRRARACRKEHEQQRSSGRPPESHPRHATAVVTSRAAGSESSKGGECVRRKSRAEGPGEMGVRQCAPASPTQGAGAGRRLAEG